MTSFRAGKRVRMGVVLGKCEMSKKNKKNPKHAQHAVTDLNKSKGGGGGGVTGLGWSQLAGEYR